MFQRYVITPRVMSLANNPSLEILTRLTLEFILELAEVSQRLDASVRDIGRHDDAKARAAKSSVAGGGA